MLCAEVAKGGAPAKVTALWDVPLVSLEDVRDVSVDTAAYVEGRCSAVGPRFAGLQFFSLERVPAIP